MSRRGSGLAARFKAAVERADAERSEEERRAEERAATARSEREHLLDDLHSLGADLPIDRTDRDADGLTWRRGDRMLRFALADDDGSVDLDYTGRAVDDVQRLFRQAELGDRWVWSRARKGRESRLPLFDKALELLLVHALGLPDPEAVAAPAPPSPSSPEADDGAEARQKRHL